MQEKSKRNASGIQKITARGPIDKINNYSGSLLMASIVVRRILNDPWENHCIKIYALLDYLARNRENVVDIREISNILMIPHKYENIMKWLYPLKKKA
jgi:hypothetical protein